MQYGIGSLILDCSTGVRAVSGKKQSLRLDKMKSQMTFFPLPQET